MPSHQGRRLFSCYRKRRCKSCMPCSLYRREEEESETCEVRRTCARDIRLSTSEYPLQKLLPLDFFHRRQNRWRTTELGREPENSIGLWSGLRSLTENNRRALSNPVCATISE